MKTWQFWVIILVFVLVVIPFLYFAVIAKNVAKVVDNSNSFDSNLMNSNTGVIQPIKSTAILTPIK